MAHSLADKAEAVSRRSDPADKRRTLIAPWVRTGVVSAGSQHPHPGAALTIPGKWQAT